MTFERLLEEWDGEQVVIHHDLPSSSWMLIGVHSTALGPAMGGTRLATYPTPADALEDVL
jgi:glutamate dehydrogenase/leucine dehydrogenase